MIKYRKEEFGYIFHSTEKVKIYSHDAEPFLAASQEVPDKYEINSFKIPKEQFHLKAPVYAFLEVTQECNLNCRHCYNTSGTVRENELSTGELLHLLDELAKMGVFCVFFTGGEPLLRKDIAELISYASSQGLEVGVFTNGTLINEELLKKIPLPTVFGVSLDDLDGHKRIRGGVTLEDMVKKIQVLKNANRLFTILTTINKDNLDDMEDIFRWSLENEVMLSTVDCLPIGRAHKDRSLLLDESDTVKIARLVIIQEQIEDIQERAFKKKNLPRSYIDDFFDFVARLEYASQRCKGGRAIAYITSEGNVFPCSNCSAVDIYMEGNLRRKSFTDIWNNSFRNIREIKWQDFIECKTCEVAKANYFCNFRCPALSKNLHNDQFVCGATPFIRKAAPIRVLVGDLMKSGLKKDELLKVVENTTCENILETLKNMVNSKKD